MLPFAYLYNSKVEERKGGRGEEGRHYKEEKIRLHENTMFLWTELTAGGSGGRSRLLLLFLLVPLSTMVVVMWVVLLLLLLLVMVVVIASVVMVIWHRRQMASSVLLLVHANGLTMMVLTIDRPHVFIMVSTSRRGIPPSIRDNAKRRPRRVRMWLLLLLLLLVMMMVLWRNMMTAVAAIFIQLHHLRARRVRRRP